MKKNFIEEYLSNEDLDRITLEIRKVEKKTSGEVRLCIKRKKSFLERKYSPRQIALKEFLKLKMQKTKDKTGVLIFLLLDEHKFEIIADEGINSKISNSHWNEMSDNLKSHFVAGNYLRGITGTIADIGQTLAAEFPRKDDDRNELPDEVMIR